MDYSCHDSYQDGDKVVRAIYRTIRRSLRPHSGAGRCLSSMRALACVSVYTECEGSDDAPRYSSILNDISRTCDISADGVSEKLLRTLNEDPADGGLQEWQGALDLWVFCVFILVVWWGGWQLVAWWSNTISMVQAVPAPLLAEAEPPAEKSGAVSISVER
ncbi:hypothetical protein GGF46_004576 [Coemansia sp. RSA 552]|nr:hypothetical protein GGF46_004576 [Coemansia sp. RSA 552]